jgi:hypothetical protein
LSDDSDSQQKYQNMANFEYLPTKLPKKPKKSKNCLEMSHGLMDPINGSDNVDGTRNYAIFDLKSRNLFLVIKKIFTECTVTVGDIGGLNEIDKKIMISLFNRKFKMTLS